MCPRGLKEPWLGVIFFFFKQIRFFFFKIKFIERMFCLSLLNFIYLFTYGCVGSSFLCEGFLQFVASGGHSSSQCAGLSLSRPLLLRSTGFRCAGSVIVAHGPSCSAACGIFWDQGSNPCPLHWQADSQPLRHQGSPGWVSFDLILDHLCCPLTLSLSASVSWSENGDKDIFFI